MSVAWEGKNMLFFQSVLLALFATISSGFAQGCFVYGPPYQLQSDTVVWSMTIGSGQSCTRGLRSVHTTLENIALVVLPRSGQVKLEGPGFMYKGDLDFRGEDSFSFLVSGKLNRIGGSSTIRVVVSVR